MRKADNLPPYCAVVKKCRSLNFLDPSGPAWPVTGVLYLYSHIKCHEYPSSMSRVVPWGQTDGQMTKLMVAFRSFAKAPKIGRGLI